MSIYAKEGEVKIEGKGRDILAELGMIVYTLREGETPELLIKMAVENGLDEHKKDNSKKDKSDRVNSILRKFGLEG